MRIAKEKFKNVSGLYYFSRGVNKGTYIYASLEKLYIRQTFFKRCSCFKHIENRDNYSIFMRSCCNNRYYFIKRVTFYTHKNNIILFLNIFSFKSFDVINCDCSFYARIKFKAVFQHCLKMLSPGNKRNIYIIIRQKCSNRSTRSACSNY
ncbi:hypothetical protein SDC9_159182 [bioreactor metagenome]|uniref:Uncharacterized protein n=1 Tax=bioreactor metagenome TaxID=1076179 RepID=A0A645FHB2_9ZZZZ